MRTAPHQNVFLHSCAGSTAKLFVGPNRRAGTPRAPPAPGKARAWASGLIAGEAGSGKTRLAARFAVDSAAPGATVLYGACEEQSLVPYTPFSEAIGGKAPEREEIEAYGLGRGIGPGSCSRSTTCSGRPNTLSLLARIARGSRATGCSSSAPTVTRTRSEHRCSQRSPISGGTVTSSAIAASRRGVAFSVDEVETRCSTAPPTRAGSTTAPTATHSSSASSPGTSPNGGNAAGGVRESVSDGCLPGSRGCHPRARKRCGGPRCWASRSTWLCSSSSMGSEGVPTRSTRPPRPDCRGRRRRTLPLRTRADPRRRLRRHRREPALDLHRRAARPGARPRARARACARRDRGRPLRGGGAGRPRAGRSSWRSGPPRGPVNGTRGSRS